MSNKLSPGKAPITPSKNDIIIDLWIRRGHELIWCASYRFYLLTAQLWEHLIVSI